MGVIKDNLQASKARSESVAALSALYKQIDDTAELVVLLYDDIERYFFQDIDFHKIEPILPLWISDSGRSPESAMDKIDYEKLHQVYNDPISNRIIHWYDVQTLLAAFQDRLMAVERYVQDTYKHIPAYCLYEDGVYTACTRGMDDTATQVHTAINGVFVTLSSAFDLLTKIVYECANYDATKFVKYNRLPSRRENILYKKTNNGFVELKDEGLLYSEPACIRTICSFRDEFIHNGAWDYRCAVYYPSIDGEPVEPFVLMPDISVEGLLVSSGSRNKFYSKGDKINVILPGLVKDVITVLAKTVTTLRNLLCKNTKQGNKDKATDSAMLIMMRNQIIGKKAMMGSKYTNVDLIKDLDILVPQFPVMYPTIAELCHDITLTEGLGEHLLYAGCENGRPFRMLMFVLILNESVNLKSDPKLGYHLLREAYLMTDNIYGQLKNSTYQFVLADYLSELEKALPNRNIDMLHPEEADIYNNLPARIKVYRGMCDDEKQSGKFGISWTLDKDYALKYIFYKKNEVKGTVGWRAEMEIDKKEIFAVWGAVGKGKEIVINPRKCNNVGFSGYKKE